jgi:hypothetical protein
VLLVVFPATVLAAGAGGTLHSTGNVMVDGKPVPPSTTVFSGDRVQTGADATATLTTDGSTVLIAGGSSIILGDNVIDLACGTAMVTTLKGMTVRVNGITITPATPSAKFEVAQGGHALSISDQEGSISVQDGHGGTTMQPGQTSTRESASTGCGPISKTPPPARNWPANVGAVGAAAAAGALIYCATNDWCQASPDKP